MKNYMTMIEPKYLELFCAYLHKSFGIFIDDPKKDILAQKLIKLMKEDNIDSIGQYYHLVLSPPISEKQKIIRNKFIDNITIHKTNFFREMNHFDFLRKNIHQILEQSANARMTQELRVWSSACSTGEEPYSLAMLFKEILPPNIRVRILATDISPQSIQTAMNGAYKFGIEDNLQNYHIQKHFTKEDNYHYISDEIKSIVTFRLFNLMEPFPFKNPFDIIFCRNVMIYFNRDTQEQLVNNFYNHLSENGLLFIGHSESLVQIKHNFGYHEPTIYKKTWNKKLLNRSTL